MENLREEQILETVVTILVDKIGLEESEIEIKSHLKNDLGLDSLDIVELIMEAEKTFDIVIDDDEMESVATVRNLVDYIVKLEKK